MFFREFFKSALEIYILVVLRSNKVQKMQAGKYAFFKKHMVILFLLDYASLHGATENHILALFGIFWHFFANFLCLCYPLTICDKSLQ